MSALLLVVFTQIINVMMLKKCKKVTLMLVCVHKFWNYENVIDFIVDSHVF